MVCEPVSMGLMSSDAISDPIAKYPWSTSLSLKRFVYVSPTARYTVYKNRPIRNKVRNPVQAVPKEWR